MEKEAEPGRRAVQIDPTVEEKNITAAAAAFPTDTKLYKKIIEKCGAPRAEKLPKWKGLSFANPIGAKSRS